MRFFGYPYNDLVICKDSPDYLTFIICARNEKNSDDTLECMQSRSIIRVRARYYKVLYLFLKNKTSLKSYILLEVLYLFDRSYIF